MTAAAFPADPPPRRRNVLGFWMCLALVMGNMIGAGVFLLPASLAPYGWNAVFGWLVTLAGGLCLAMVFARLASAVPHAGGPYAYTRAAFGPAAGFAVAWSYWISLWVGNAAIAVAGVGYLAVFVPAIGTTPGAPALLACLSIWGLTAVNCRGVRTAGGVQMVTTVLKLLPLLAVMVLGALLVGRSGGAAILPFRAADIGIGAIGTTAAITLWGLLGLESATIVAHDVDRPARTIPRATLWGTALTGAIYLLVCSSVTLLMPPALAAASSAPLADFVSLAWGGNAGRVIALFAAISAFGALNGWTMLQGEMPRAMAQDGVFPAFFARLSRRGVPVRAHIGSSLCLTAIVLLNYTRSLSDLFTFIALLATTASLVAYLACSAAALVLARRQRLPAGRGFVVVALLAGGYSLWTIYGAGPEAAGWGMVLLAIGVPVHLLMRRYAPLRPITAPAKGMGNA
jgi:APA family basic amino acid/polyamine antiporter